MQTFLQPSFRGVEFNAEESQAEFGLDLVVHQYPQSDGFYIESLGRKGRSFMIPAFVVGDGWEKSRDDLIKACEATGSGILIHPDFGSITVYCQSCVVRESKLNTQRRADLMLTFLESGNNQFRTNISQNYGQSGQFISDYDYLNIADRFTESWDSSAINGYFIFSLGSIIPSIFGQLKTTRLGSPFLDQLIGTNIYNPQETIENLSAFIAYTGELCGNNAPALARKATSATSSSLAASNNRTESSLFAIAKPIVLQPTNPIDDLSIVSMIADTCETSIKRAPITDLSSVQADTTTKG